MELSLFLAKVLGLYLLIVCVAVLVNRKMVSQLVEKLNDHLPFLVFSGAIFLILGLAIVVSHNVWTTDWRVLITVLGWMTIVKAVIRLFIPDKIQPLARKFTGPWINYWVVFFLIVGVYLTYIGFYY